jgi:hypothetical protein
MAWSMGYTDANRLLVMTYRDAVSFEELVEANRQALVRIMEQQITKVMVDCSACRAEMPIVDIYKLPDMYAASGVTHQMRVAMILPKDSHRLDIYEFYEDICRNRGYFVKLFEAAEAAWTWLRSSETPGEYPAV